MALAAADFFFMTTRGIARSSSTLESASVAATVRVDWKNYFKWTCGRLEVIVLARTRFWSAVQKVTPSLPV